MDSVPFPRPLPAGWNSNRRNTVRPVDVIEGGVSALDRSDVDTDQIIPKQFLKRVERTGFGEFLFYDWLRSGEIELEPSPILVAGRNFGCGSSREHAPWALEDFGFEAIVAPSFADIFYVNCTKVGLLPVVLDEEHCRALAAAGEARIDVDDQTVTCAEGVFEFEIEPDVKHRLLHGLDDIGITLESAAAIDEFEAAQGVAGPVTTAL
jgi:3-isopropylmalate/(R)-2-methylmalate dehydratase small subunit